MTIAVLNKYKMPVGTKGTYIGRGSPLGNPFIIGVHGTRDEVIDLYIPYLQKQIDGRNPTIIKALYEISLEAKSEEGANLICFCKPQRCHGDEIKTILEGLLK